MPRESRETKALRLLTSARLMVTRVDDRTIEAKCRGDSGEVYELGFRPGEWFCSCQVRGQCSHLLALWHVVVRPGSLTP